jgi:hypothetical protein
MGKIRNYDKYLKINYNQQVNDVLEKSKIRAITKDD